jgi:hypothetical protein
MNQPGAVAPAGRAKAAPARFRLRAPGRPDRGVAGRYLIAAIAQALQHAIMRTDRLPQRRTAVIGHAMLGRQALDDRAQLPVMNVADPREQMVLDLVVQPADVQDSSRLPRAKLLVVCIW